MKHLFSILLILLLPISLIKGQVEEVSKRKNSIYMEILGNGVVYSLNYERLFLADSKTSPYLRLGGTMLHIEETDSFRPYIVSEAGIIIGQQKNFFDTSLGYTRSFDEEDKDRFLVIRAGFRYSGPKGFLFRISPMYIFNTQTGDDVFGNNFWFGASLGYAF